ncbi:hypothetical protein MCCL_1566 [Macrococcoides caseolyticum JCSC5402]|uniref:Uncharacterized protein n=1 Tax=Macrococcus caseolyticus (strain JCSC5402) TaxID=458233 RepID=B9E7V6_MACCJ|nr:hypothetical protein MCCL_1566 [Macrococcus caseolyticus JCSC5402]
MELEELKPTVIAGAKPLKNHIGLRLAKNLIAPPYTRIICKKSANNTTKKYIPSCLIAPKPALVNAVATKPNVPIGAKYCIIAVTMNINISFVCSKSSFTALTFSPSAIMPMPIKMAKVITCSMFVSLIASTGFLGIKLIKV